MKLLIEGVFTLKTPLHVAHAGMEGSVESGQIRRYRQGAVPLPLVPTQQIPVFSELAGQDAATGGRGVRLPLVPIYPGSALRGRIHAAAGNDLIHDLLRRSLQLTREEYHVLRVNTFSGAGARVEPTVSGVSAAQNDLYAAVFGGGPMMLRSLLVTNDLFPIISDTVSSGLIADKFVRQIDRDLQVRGENITFYQPSVRRDALLEFSDPLAPMIVKEYEPALLEWQTLCSESNAARKAERESAQQKRAAKKAGMKVASEAPALDPVAPAAAAGGEAAKAKKVSLKNQQAIEAVAPGVRFYVRVGLREGARSEHVGMITAALGAVIEANDLGGYSRNGYGRFSAALDVTVNDATFENAITFNGNGLKIGQELKPHLEAYRTVLQSYTPEQFARAYSLGNSPDASA
ncbi:MAG TPA: hypothetical protein VHE37_10495 [Nevskiaceae bacterium]|nr:hypothetical protein [Nevskiaceae bacterium]